MRLAGFIVSCSLVVAGIAAGAAFGQGALIVEVYKAPTCGCCSMWVAHLEDHGFTVKTTDVPNINRVKSIVGVPERVTSCHTAIVDGYVVEGHVPAEDVRRLLADRPPIKGIAVAGMPIGSPGMEGRNPQAYDVIAFDEDGELTLFSAH
jgi:hypothetical protein